MVSYKNIYTTSIYASYVGGLLPKVSNEIDGLMPSSGFIYRGEVVTDFGNDFNNCTQTGYYRIHNASDSENSPGIKWGGLIVTNMSGYILQRAYASSEIKYKFRISDGTWRPWANINYSLD